MFSDTLITIFLKCFYCFLTVIVTILIVVKIVIVIRIGIIVRIVIVIRINIDIRLLLLHCGLIVFYCIYLGLAKMP